jgi:uncharacterized protein
MADNLAAENSVLIGSALITSLPQSGFRRAPWKNGGGVSLVFAELRAPEAAPDDWSGVIWQFGRTTISAPTPFSDLSGYDRLQTVISGRGLVLETNAGEVDLREPLRVVRYDGALKIMTRLESGPVEVVNLMGRRDRVALEMHVIEVGGSLDLKEGTVILYAPGGQVEAEVDGAAIQIEKCDAALAENAHRVVCNSGTLIAASIRKAHPSVL